MELIKKEKTLTLVFSRPTLKEYSISFSISILAAIGVCYFFEFKKWIDVIMNLSVIAAFIYLGFNLIDDTFIVSIDKGENEVRFIRKDLFKRILSIKVLQADELALCEIVTEKFKNSVGYRMMFEFLVDGRIFKVSSTKVLMIGRDNLLVLESWEEEIRNFLNLRIPPQVLEKIAERKKKEKEETKKKI
ncbi:hypothetical protein HK099_006811 [Clydaea vesicula]|uniref:Uncharacterized protein n=1 Tax=Clydaea vesicula TaxID=447962 RepID=A0AAD5U5T3_9FUNG|nr:hypothetical protein HK099_006811 [Clydaea vesicula]